MNFLNVMSIRLLIMMDIMLIKDSGFIQKIGRKRRLVFIFLL